ncbi:hypothetical protein [Desulfosporosinus sp. Sb-LF]|uniref:hypothetical protein n=1 Tax=Desulfosporosinus sp. Sb-LF TaxID=2560027 RepID=UPI00107F15A4|nr:hypothetical protein [Desulfosporosinus sp. Sb-LF]TGE32449.1 hypothetical protein E4K68_12710 [Desulfosporosinus sp. Sb-LF]
MLSFSSLVFSWRMRLSRLKTHKISLSIGALFIIAISLLGPPVYQESWLDPFSTLNIPNRELRPHAINKVGILNSDDPFHPYYYINEGKIQDLLQNLQRATALSSDQDLGTLESQKKLYFTLHRAPSRYHTEEDYTLQYYPAKSIVRFGQQTFRINESTIYAFSQITDSMTSGWWK